MQILPNRRIAYILTRICYREAKCWEDYHSQKVKLDMHIYEEMLSTVKLNLLFYLQFVKYMRMSKEEWLSIVKELPQQVQDIMLAILLYSSGFFEWEPAEKLNEQIPKDITTFLLCGRLKLACENGEVLDNSLMKQINIDVHNRMFTLIKNNRI